MILPLKMFIVEQLTRYTKEISHTTLVQTYSTQTISEHFLLWQLRVNVERRWWFSCYVVSDSCDLWTVACQAPQSMGFSRQEYWNGLPFPSVR